ncbi:MAG: hypothetical protein ABL901_06005 [Hyphomicrobiaceae bacterium]
MRDAIFTDWTPDLTTAWANAPLRARHTLHRHPLYTFEALAELIERYPREHYALIHMGAQGGKREWREGDIGNLSGEQVITAIKAGRMWLNLRNIGAVDPRYKDVLDQIFEEVRTNVPGYDTYNRTSGILISSPSAQVYYHCDLPGQSLWQIHGKKRVYVYPTRAPFLTPEQLETIALYEVEVDMAYDKSYDKDALVFEIGGGEMLHWPLNAPHRVENLDVLNVSMTTEYWTESIRRNMMVTLGNAILRNRLGIAARSTALKGPAFWAKAALQAGVRRAGLLKPMRKAKRPIEFQLDKANLGQIIEYAPKPAMAAE